jgi:hypothetical protein
MHQVEQGQAKHILKWRKKSNGAIEYHKRWQDSEFLYQHITTEHQLQLLRRVKGYL